MVTPIAFDRNFDAPYETVEQVSPLIRRMLAHNPSPFTFMGTGVYIVGRRDVGSSRVDLQACKLEYSIVSPK